MSAGVCCQGSEMAALVTRTEDSFLSQHPETVKPQSQGWAGMPWIGSYIKLTAPCEDKEGATLDLTTLKVNIARQPASGQYEDLKCAWNGGRSTFSQDHQIVFIQIRERRQRAWVHKHEPTDSKRHKKTTNNMNNYVICSRSVVTLCLAVFASS